MPPELIVLGDRLEAAARREVARRRARRQVVLNAAASVIVAVPLGLSVAASGTAPPPPAVPDARTAPATHVPADYIPRDMRRRRGAPHAELSPLPTNLRRVLR